MNPLFEISTEVTTDILFVDCRHSLKDKGLGQRLYEDHHLPNAMFADIEKDMSDPKKISKKIYGRHPLPAVEDFINFLQLNGINSDTHLVAYDDDGGVYAARFWWMLNWIGHYKVSILNGGLKAWQKAGNHLENTKSVRKRGQIQKKPGLVHQWNIAEISALVESEKNNEVGILIDARMPERFNGKVEPLDFKAGHIAGALNRPYVDNLEENGYFKSPEKLRKEFLKVLNYTNPASVVHMCGSGITACHNLVSMEIAQLVGSNLYVGSWSEWIQHN
ncbi:sulfurtransferase [Betaproteobacteria bacterium]|nr:sulfurtransferase [Betaproteobacteria bacterium]